jgi:hypothetical protein
MTRLLKTLGAATAAISLVACGSSNTPNASGPVQVTSLISAEEELLRVFADDGVTIRDLGDLLANGETLTVRNVSEAMTRRNFETDTYERVDGDVRIELDGNALLVTISVAGDPNPDTIRINNANLITENFREFEVENEYFIQIFVDGGIDSLFETGGELDYARSFYVFYDAFDGIGLTVESVIGAETTDATINQLQVDNETLQYEGGMFTEIRRQGDGFEDFNAVIRGDVTMTADFGAGSISGEITEMEFEFGDGMGSTTIDVDGTLAMQETAILDNAFAGTMAGDQAFLTDNDAMFDEIGGNANVVDLDYSGAFYGPEADEVGGVVSGQWSGDGEGFITRGTFGGGLAPE